MSFSPASPEAGNLSATVVAIKRAINPFTRSTSMNLLRLMSENALPLPWPTYMASSTSTWLPCPVETTWTRASCTWMTARSSTSARNISLAPNPIVIPITCTCSASCPGDLLGHCHSLVNVAVFLSPRLCACAPCPAVPSPLAMACEQPAITPKSP
jgi:hypothetical protein